MTNYSQTRGDFYHENERSRASTRFFKVLLDDFTHKLVLPNRFVQDLRKERTDFFDRNTTAKIRVRPIDGCYWDVKVEREEEEASRSYRFGEGWGDFVAAHDLQFGYFVMLDHVGNLAFDLTVFDLSGCSKIYASATDRIPTKQKGCWNDGEEELVIPRKRRRTIQGEHLKENSKATSDVIIDVDEAADGVSGSENKHAFTPIDIDESPKGEDIQAKSSAPLVRAKFEHVVRSYHIRGTACMYIPVSSSKYLKGKSSMWLENSKGLSWRVSLCYQRRPGPYCGLAGGFRKFCHDNWIKAGDTCRFEIRNRKGINVDDVVMHVDVVKK